LRCCCSQAWRRSPACHQTCQGCSLHDSCAKPCSTGARSSCSMSSLPTAGIKLLGSRCATSAGGSTWWCKGDRASSTCVDRGVRAGW
jgi:hypothetical protein